MLEKLKKMFIKGEDDKGSKKHIENLVALIIILVVTVIMINNIWNDDETEEVEDDTRQLASTSETSQDISEESVNLQEELEEILSTMSGVEEVNVLLNYSESSSVVAMYNENTTNSSTEETDSNGGVRTITETDVKKEVVFSDEDGDSTPVTEKIIMPKIEGAIVTVKGATDATTKSNIVSAISAVTGLATHKIQVFAMD